MLRLSNRLQSSRLLFRQTRNYTRRLGVVIPQRGILLLQPQNIAPQARFIHASNVLFSEIIEVQGPAFAESISEGDIRWIKQKGDFVKEDELVAEIETDKTSVEVPAQFSGTIVELLVEDGARVTAKQKLYKLQKGGEASSSQSEKKDDAPTQGEKADAKTENAEAPVKGAPKAPEAGSSDASPPAKPKTESSERVDPPEQPHAKPGVSDIPPKLPKDLVKASKEPMLSTPVDKIQRTPISIPKGIPADQAITGSRSETRVKANRMRQRIAQRLKDAQNTYAMLTTFNEIDMTNVMEMRTRYQKDFMKKHGIKLGLMSPFVRAAAYAMTDQPIVNAVFDETEIVYRQFVDISIAVATPKGLVVPVLRNVEGMDYAKIELSLAELGEKARDGKLAVEDMEGGTFTISNGGVFGSMFGTPIINPPQSAILGMHGIFDRPVAINGKVEVRPMMYIALTYDHRLIDGREAVTFLKKIKSSVEDPRTILMNL
uniref:Dihydrolipoyllysine-residue succinyltransferase component of 2-oxoglutarate dehydrogenase complex, mitochondrial n=1 Tax=Panagrolaimus superbus TaxID=310955 RepID=A0A914Z1H2_9BILA